MAPSEPAVSVADIAALTADGAGLDARWKHLADRLTERFGKAPEIEYILFLIGIQTRGQGYVPDLPRETKQALIMEGAYTVLAGLGFYQQVGMEADGAWIWEKTAPLPSVDVDAQERLLQAAILQYLDAAPDAL